MRRFVVVRLNLEDEEAAMGALVFWGLSSGSFKAVL